MNEKHSRHKGSKALRPKQSPLLEVITCPRCGFDMELWTDEHDTRCMNCGHRFFRKESTVH